jgi:uncharacterized repeat protein (TIGR04042 family)
MPEMHFDIRWPDGREERCYSPSLVVQEHLQVGADYALPDFITRVTMALGIASERVRAKYGFACSRALGQLAALEHSARGQAPGGRVQVLAFDPLEIP